jgi:hypothetical protein
VNAFNKDLVTIAPIEAPVFEDVDKSINVANILYGGVVCGNVAVFITSRDDSDSFMDEDDEAEGFSKPPKQAAWPSLEIPYGYELDDMYVYPINALGSGFEYSGFGKPLNPEWLKEERLLAKIQVALEDRYEQVLHMARLLQIVEAP